jgi:hypothetical protein
VGTDQPICDRKSQPRSGGHSRLLQAVKPLEDPVSLIGNDTQAVVRHLDHDLARHLPHAPDLDLGCLGRVRNGVVDQDHSTPEGLVVYVAQVLANPTKLLECLLQRAGPENRRKSWQTEVDLRPGAPKQTRATSYFSAQVRWIRV